MSRTTRTVVVASLALAALTGCGGAAAEAKGAHTYEPLPPFSTATPTTSPAPQPTSPAAPKSSPAPTAEATADSAAPAGGAAQAAPVGGTAGPSIPGQAPAAGTSSAFGQAPAAVAGPVGGGMPIQATERTSTSTTTTTSTTVEAGLKLVVTCEGPCMLGDLSASELAGQDGPFSEDLLRQALEKELGGQGGDQQRLTDELLEQLMQGQWALAERDLEGGDEKLVFSSAGK